MNKKFLLLAALPTLCFAAATAKPAAPFVNHYLSASTYSIIHQAAAFTPLAGPVGPGRRLRADEIRWKTIGPVNGFAPIYSGPYPNGKRVIWVGGYDRVAKLDADSMDVLSTYTIGGNTFFGDGEIKRYIAAMDKLSDADLVAHNLKVWPPLFASASSAYHLLSKDNEFYLPYRGADGTISLRVYGDADPADPASAIRLRREWKIPADIAKGYLFGMTMTADGWIVLATSDGTLIALSRDFATHSAVKLPSLHEEGANQDLFSAFVRNGIVTDESGGIYVVTRDHMHRVQWTGSKLSLNAADRAWSEGYPNELVIGSGTTPALMGWGPNEDHLVIIADASKSNNMIAFWRDKIPDDWKALPGFDRRVAGITPIRFGVSKSEQVQVENTPLIYGYGAFFNNTFPVARMTKQDRPSKQWLADSFTMNVPGHEARGGTMIRWDPQARQLKTAWQTQTNFVSTVCTVSGATEMVYCWGARDREWTLEGTDWNSGKSAFHYVLGKSQRFNPLGGLIIVAPDGAIDCGCVGGFGMVRVKPKSARTAAK